MKTSKNVLSTEYHIFLKKYFPEHNKRLNKAKSHASLVRIVYPLTFFLFPLVIFCTFSFVLTYFREPIAQFFAQTRIAESLEPDVIKAISFTIFGVGVIVALLAFFFGVFFGFTKARDLLFESEKLDMNVRQLWALEHINQQNPKTTASCANRVVPLNQLRIF